MNLKFRCPHCEIRLTVAAHKSGQTSRCPNCQGTLRIPEAPQEAAAREGTAPLGRGGSARSEAPPHAAPVSPASSNLELGALIPASPPGSTSPEVGEEVATSLVTDRATPSDESGIEAWSRNPPDERRWVRLPRWVIYSQAGLLAIVASTFFVLGLMTREWSGGGGTQVQARYDCQLTGVVQVRRGDQLVPDAGAVVIVLPADRTPAARPEARTLRPDAFQPLDNPAIQAIEALGGRVVRANAAGSFDLTLSGPRDYNVLIISRQAVRAGESPIPKAQIAAIGRYFFPVEELVGRQAFHWGTIKLNRQSQTLPAVAFDGA